MPSYINNQLSFLDSVYAPFAGRISSSQTGSDNLLLLKANDLLRIETEENSGTNDPCRIVRFKTNHYNMMKNKVKYSYRINFPSLR